MNFKVLQFKHSVEDKALSKQMRIILTKNFGLELSPPLTI